MFQNNGNSVPAKSLQFTTPSRHELPTLEHNQQSTHESVGHIMSTSEFLGISSKKLNPVKLRKDQGQDTSDLDDTTSENLDLGELNRQQLATSKFIKLQESNLTLKERHKLMAALASHHSHEDRDTQKPLVHVHPSSSVEHLVQRKKRNGSKPKPPNINIEISNFSFDNLLSSPTNTKDRAHQSSYKRLKHPMAGMVNQQLFSPQASQVPTQSLLPRTSTKKKPFEHTPSTSRLLAAEEHLNQIGTSAKDPFLFKKQSLEFMSPIHASGQAKTRQVLRDLIDFKKMSSEFVSSQQQKNPLSDPASTEGILQRSFKNNIIPNAPELKLGSKISFLSEAEPTLNKASSLLRQQDESRPISIMDNTLAEKQHQQSSAALFPPYKKVASTKKLDEFTLPEISGSPKDSVFEKKIEKLQKRIRELKNPNMTPKRSFPTEIGDRTRANRYILWNESLQEQHRCENSNDLDSKYLEDVRFNLNSGLQKKSSNTSFDNPGKNSAASTPSNFKLAAEMTSKKLHRSGTNNKSVSFVDVLSSDDEIDDKELKKLQSIIEMRKQEKERWNVQNNKIEQNIIDVSVTEDMVLGEGLRFLSPRRIHLKQEQQKKDEKMAKDNHCSNLSLLVQRRINNSKLNFTNLKESFENQQSKTQVAHDLFLSRESSMQFGNLNDISSPQTGKPGQVVVRNGATTKERSPFNASPLQPVPPRAPQEQQQSTMTLINNDLFGDANTRKSISKLIRKQSKQLKMLARMQKDEQLFGNSSKLSDPIEQRQVLNQMNSSLRQASRKREMTKEFSTTNQTYFSGSTAQRPPTQLANLESTTYTHTAGTHSGSDEELLSAMDEDLPSFLQNIEQYKESVQKTSASINLTTEEDFEQKKKGFMLKMNNLQESIEDLINDEKTKYNQWRREELQKNRELAKIFEGKSKSVKSRKKPGDTRSESTSKFSLLSKPQNPQRRVSRAVLIPNNGTERVSEEIKIEELSSSLMDSNMKASELNEKIAMLSPSSEIKSKSFKSPKKDNSAMLRQKTLALDAYFKIKRPDDHKVSFSNALDSLMDESKQELWTKIKKFHTFLTKDKSDSVRRQRDEMIDNFMFYAETVPDLISKDELDFLQRQVKEPLGSKSNLQKVSELLQRILLYQFIDDHFEEIREKNLQGGAPETIGTAQTFQTEASELLPPPTTSEFLMKVLETAIVNTGDIELFEHGLMKTSQEKDLGSAKQYELEAISKYISNLETKNNMLLNQYLKYLSGGVVENKMIFQIAQAIKIQMKSGDLISKFNQKNASLVDLLIRDLFDRISFKRVCSSAELSKAVKYVSPSSFKVDEAINDSKEAAKNMANQAYFIECEKRKGVPLPVFQKIFNKRLILQDYHLTEQVCRALSEGFRSNPRILTQIFIENSGLTDDLLSIIVEGASKLEHLHTLDIRNSEFGFKSIVRLQRILRVSFPYQIQVLKIIKCKITQEELEHLLSNLNRQSFIQELVLIKANFNKGSIQKLCRFIENSEFLTQLDISWNELTSKQYRPILQSLGLNTQLEKIVLSHNMLLESKVSDMEEFKKAKELQKKQASEAPTPPEMKVPEVDEEGSPIREFDQPDTESEIELAEMLNAIITNNKCLIHLFLNQCGLTKEVIHSLLPYMKNSPSLAAIHLSNNPGVNSRNMAEFKENLGIFEAQIDIMSPQAHNHQFLEFHSRMKRDLHKSSTIMDAQFEVIKYSIEEPTSAAHQVIPQMEPISNRRKAESSVNLFKSARGVSPRAPSGTLLSVENLEHIQTRKILKEKAILDGYLMTQDPFVDKIFVLQRIIGYDDQLVVRPSQLQLFDGGKEVSRKMLKRVKEHCPSPSNWQLITSREKKCWVCDRMIYSLLLWNEFVGKYKNLQIRNQHQVLGALQKLPYKTDRPVLYTYHNNWQGRELHTISEFCFIIEKRKRAKYSRLTQEDVRDLEFKDPKSEGNQDVDQKLWERLQSYKKPSVFRDVLHKNLDFRETQFINCQNLVMQDIEKNWHRNTTYVLPLFLQAGRFSYIIEYPQGKFHFHKSVIHFRSESLPLKMISQEFEVDRAPAFNKQTSMFAGWKEDTPQRISEALHHDLRTIILSSILQTYWEQQTFQHYLEENFDKLKFIYTCVLALSQQVDGIDLYSLRKFILRRVGIPGIRKEDVDREFEMSTKLPIEFSGKVKKDDSKRPDLMCRKEFIEFLIRIAQLQFDRTEVPDESCKSKIMFMKGVVKAIMNKIDRNEGQVFREEELWTAEVNSIFFQNKEGLTKMLRRYKNPLTFDCLEAIFMRDSSPPIVTKRADLIKAAVMSKQTVIYDFESENRQMKVFSDVEFLEITARIVEIRSHDTQMEDLFLNQKVSSIILQLLRINH